jgi:hypothetical protein
MDEEEKENAKSGFHSWWPFQVSGEKIQSAQKVTTTNTTF